MLELRIGIETEGPRRFAALRRSDQNLADMRAALSAVARAIDEGATRSARDQFHLEIARATQNEHFGADELLGATIIPRRASRWPTTRRRSAATTCAARQRRARGIYDAIAGRDADAARAAMHAPGQQPRAPTPSRGKAGDAGRRSLGPIRLGRSAGLCR